MFYPYIILSNQYDSIDWAKFELSLNKVEAKREEIEAESISRILKYAKELNFFTKEEYEDLEFGIFDIELNIVQSEITKFVTSYGIDENENSKVHWKDIYGVWKVFFENNKVIDVVRE